MSQSFDILLLRLEMFIRRYYLNLLIKGAIMFGAGFFLLFLTVAILEYFGYFGSTVRLLFFYGFLAFNLVVFIVYVLRPLAGFFSLGKRIGPMQAAKILGNHFRDEISDKITNALELQEFLGHHHENYQLVLASIEQKSQKTLVVPFSRAIDLKNNHRLVPYFLAPFLVVAISFIAKPGLLLEPASRIANYNVFFEKPAPFSFIIQNASLTAFKNEDFILVLKTQGQVVPNDAGIKLGSSLFGMNSLGKGEFSYRFRNVQESISFFVESGGFTFGPYMLEVVEKPTFSHFTVTVANPDYTKLGTEVLGNVGDLVVAQGATIKWQFHTRGGGSGHFIVGEDRIDFQEIKPGIFSSSFYARESFSYSVKLSDDKHGISDSLRYFVQVKSDAWPQILAEESHDSLLVSHIFYKVKIEDDYGFSKVEFRYRIFNDQQGAAGENVPYKSVEIPINNDSRTQVFFHHFDFNTIDLKAGQSVETYLVVYDNDRVNGPKSSSSRKFFHHLSTREELIALGKETREEIKNQISSNIKSNQSARDHIEKLRRDLLQNPKIGWEQQRALQQILKKQEELKESFEKVRGLEQKNEALQSQFNKNNEHLERQRDELEKILDEIKNSDMGNLMEKIFEMLQNLNKEMVFEMINNMELQLENFQNQMARALEFYKRLELEYLLQESKSILDQASQDQQTLIKDSQSGSSPSAELKIQQEKINKDFKNVSELLDEFREKNQDLRRPLKIDDTRSLENQIERSLDQSLNDLQQGNPSGSVPSQRSGRQGMEQLSQRIAAMQLSMFQNQQREDAKALRQILENLLKISFAQENLMARLMGVNFQDPRYLDIIQGQRKVQEDMKMVEDSLVSLGKRQPQVDIIITNELQQIRLYLAGSMASLLDRQIGIGSSRQQFVMTHVNNLALLLNEALQNMQMQMQGGGEGDGSSSMGGPGVKIQDIGQMQQRLNQILEQLQQGHQPTSGQRGQQGSVSEQLARAAAQQEALRNRLGELLKKLQDSGYDIKQLQEVLGDMERTEADIVNRRITVQTISRQNQILTRLLEHQNALMQREIEERREGTTAKNSILSNPELYFEYNRIRTNQQEILRKIPLRFKGFYQGMTEKYLINLQ